ncbi:PEGA domain-containing protein [Candidatus Bathyarchaeota archaeon]|nr:PEGA domain-containing protein [Candidatus Bathyarchaeota archaeon]MBT7913761.1 PEGA domain-containing protein [Candidatus Bathyarchaeota archaeon]
MKRILIIFLLLLLPSCYTIPARPGAEGAGAHSAPHSPPETTLIISDPPGAKIEINHEYVGDAPVSFHIEAQTSMPHGQITEDVVIVAYPTEDGQYTQIKNLRGVKIPKRIYFNMSLKPVSDDGINIEINQ